MKLFRRKQRTALEQIQQMSAQIDDLTVQLLNRNAQTVAQLIK